MQKIIAIGVFSLLILVSFGFCITIPERPVTSFTKDPDFKTHIASPDVALSFAYHGNRDVLLVVDDNAPQGILAIKLDGEYQDAFDALSTYGRPKLISLAKSKEGAQWYPQQELAPITQHQWHVAFGANFEAHADETEVEHPFAFPKIVSATPSLTKLKAPHLDALIDYEAEICMIFDRDIHSHQDFLNAKKGVFLCADTTDRATLLRDIPADEEHLSGRGFTDAKSYDGFFSTGPYLVIPHDWESFVAHQPITTRVNDTLMQYAHGAEMTLDFEEIVSYILEKWDRVSLEAHGESIYLLQNGVIQRGSALLSGTGDGVIFRPPTSFNDLFCGGTAFVCTASFLTEMTGRDYVIERYIDQNLKAKTFLQPSEIVKHESKNLGHISIMIEK